MYEIIDANGKVIYENKSWEEAHKMLESIEGEFPLKLVEVKGVRS
jgi:hypothetical protein